MATDNLLGREAGPVPSQDQAAEEYRLLRQYEPILRFTKGELFLPMAVERYVANCSLWRSVSPGRRGRGSDSERVCAPADLTVMRLAELGAQSGPGLSLRFAERSLSRKELRAWRRD